MPTVEQHHFAEKETNRYWTDLLYLLGISSSFSSFVDTYEQFLPLFDTRFSQLDLQNLLLAFFQLKILSIAVQFTFKARQSFHEAHTLTTEDKGHRTMRLSWLKSYQIITSTLDELEKKYSVEIDPTSDQTKIDSRHLYQKKRFNKKKSPKSHNLKKIATSSLSPKPHKKIIDFLDIDILLEQFVIHQSGWYSWIHNLNANKITPLSQIIQDIQNLNDTNQKYVKSLKLPQSVTKEVINDISQPFDFSVFDSDNDLALVVLKSNSINFVLPLEVCFEELINSLKLCDNIYCDLIDLEDSDSRIGCYQELLIKSKNNVFSNDVESFNPYSLFLFTRTLLTSHSNSMASIVFVDIKMQPIFHKLFPSSNSHKLVKLIHKDDHQQLHRFLLQSSASFYKNCYFTQIVKSLCTTREKYQKFGEQFQVNVRTNANAVPIIDGDIGIFIKRSKNPPLKLYYYPVFCVTDPITFEENHVIIFRTSNQSVIQSCMNISKMTNSPHFNLEFFVSEGYDILSDFIIMDKRTKRLNCYRASSGFDLSSITKDQICIKAKSIINMSALRTDLQIKLFMNNQIEPFSYQLVFELPVPGSTFAVVNMNTIVWDIPSSFYTLASYLFKSNEKNPNNVNNPARTYVKLE